MRPMLTAVVVALVLLTAAFMIVVPAQDRTLSNPAAASSGLRAAADVTPNYTIVLDFATEPILPGYHDNFTWEVVNNTNDAPIQTLTGITIKGSYYNTLDKLLPLPGTPINVTPKPIGSWTFVLPANTSSDVAFEPLVTLWANSTTMKMNESQSDSLEVGVMDLLDARVCSVTGTCPSPAMITTGTPATVSVYTYALDGFGDTSPLAGETAKFIFFSTGSSPVTVPGVPASVKTNGVGYAAVTFTPSSSIFNVPGPNHVEIEVTDQVNTSLTKYMNVTFALLNPAGTTNYNFWLNADEYYSGESGTAFWQWAGTNSTVGTLNVTNYNVYDEDTGNIIASGLVGSTSPSGSFVFTLPGNYVGEFDVEAYAHNGSDSWVWDAFGESSAALLFVTASEYYYNPGDTITVTVTAEGPAIAGATISAFVQATNSGQTLFNGTVTGTSFQFTVPKIAPAAEYEIAVWASSPTAGTIDSTTQDVEAASGYVLWTGISSVSSYSDGSFSPGQTVTLSYKVIAYGADPLPTLVEVEVCTYYCDDTPAVKVWIVSGSSGSVPFTVPAGAPNGPQTFFTEVLFLGGGGADGVFTVVVNSSPSALNYELVGGSGLTVGWLILLILVIIVALVIVATRRRGKPGRMTMSPSGGSTPEWKEPQPAPSTPPSGGGGGTSDAPATPPGTQ